MAESIRYRFLMLRLRREIAKAVKKDSAGASAAQNDPQPTCKVCGSIV